MVTIETKAVQEVACEYCGKLFTVNSNSKHIRTTCSDACRQLLNWKHMAGRERFDRVSADW